MGRCIRKCRVDEGEVKVTSKRRHRIFLTGLLKAFRESANAGKKVCTPELWVTSTRQALDTLLKCECTLVQAADD